MTEKVTASGNEAFAAWRERDRDDLVLALAMACWLAEEAWRQAARQEEADVVVVTT
jgi:hypothetical protein